MLRHSGNISGAAKLRSKCPEVKVQQFKLHQRLEEKELVGLRSYECKPMIT